MLSRIDVRLPPESARERTYPIFLDAAGGAEVRFAEELVRRMRPAGGPRSGPPTVALLTDETVNRLHRQRYQHALEQRSIQVVPTVVADGEGSKSLATVEAVAESWAQAGLDRGAWVVALGGGVVGDLGGLLASVFLRGLTFVQVPTTLLAQVDSSVGGKTGVNLAAGKNLVGTFLQPRFVWSDLTTLRTLDARDVSSGLAEVVKHAVLADAGLLEMIEERPGDARGADPQLLSSLVARSCLVKARVVASDEHETNPSAPGGGRAQLNFGHTVGHAIESASHHAPDPKRGPLRHGEAVALGMIAAARVGARLGTADPRLEARLTQLLGALGLPTGLDAWLRPEVLDRLRVDKKRVGGSAAGSTPASPMIRFVVVERVGVPRLVPLEAARIVELLLGGKS